MAVILELKQIEQKMIAGRYRKHLAKAMAAACNRLTADERFLLLLHYEAGLSSQEIEKSLGSHFKGVMQELRKVHGKLRDYIIHGLSTEPDMNGRTIAECLRDMVENPYHEIFASGLHQRKYGPAQAAGKCAPRSQETGINPGKRCSSQIQGLIVSACAA